MTVITYAVIVLVFRVVLLLLTALGFLVTGFICWHEYVFHGVDGIVLGMRNLCFCLCAIFGTFLIVSIANLFDLKNEHLYLFAWVNTLTVVALVALVLFFYKLGRKLLKENKANNV